MKMRQKVVDLIFNIANSTKFEIGGILGSSEKGVITDMVPDLPMYACECRFEYYPNISYLNREILEWSNKNIEFMGLFHTHFSGSCNLSEEDKKYIRAIMESAKGIAECLYFPIFTLPDNDLNVYKAYFDGDEIFINRDDLEII